LGARVYKDGKLVEVVRSVPVYSVINGFWIKAIVTTIVIRYVSQECSSWGLRISGTIGIRYIDLFSGIFYDYIK